MDGIYNSKQGEHSMDHDASCLSTILVCVGSLAVMATVLLACGMRILQALGLGKSKKQYANGTNLRWLVLVYSLFFIYTCIYAFLQRPKWVYMSGFAY